MEKEEYTIPRENKYAEQPSDLIDIKILLKKIEQQHITCRFY